MKKTTISLEKSGRKGKVVTVVKHIQHNPDHIEKLAKLLKTRLGTGGTVKGKNIEIQGSHVEKVKALLEQEGITF